MITMWLVQPPPIHPSKLPSFNIIALSPDLPEMGVSCLTTTAVAKETLFYSILNNIEKKPQSLEFSKKEQKI